MQAEYIPFIVFASIIGIITVVFIYNRVTSSDDDEEDTLEGEKG